MKWGKTHRRILRNYIIHKKTPLRLIHIIPRVSLISFEHDNYIDICKRVNPLFTLYFPRFWAKYQAKLISIPYL